MNESERMLESASASSLAGKISVYRQRREFGQPSGVCSGGIATALKDHRQQCCLIPVQPNRSLPVHPAPHHTRFRYNLATNDNRQPEETMKNKPEDRINNNCNDSNGIIKISILSRNEIAKAEDRPDELVSIIVEEKPLVEGNDPPEEQRDEEKARIDEIENELIERMESFTRGPREIEARAQESKISWCETEPANPGPPKDPWNVGVESPEVIVDLEPPSPGNPGIRVESTTSDFILESFGAAARLGSSSTGKKQKRRRTSKNHHENNRIDGSVNKTVPPLRLKKIRARDNESKKRREIRKLESVRKISTERDLSENSSKYRIVSQPPIIDDTLMNRDIYQSKNESLHAAKLKYKKSKLVVKLEQLRGKTIELGKEMIRNSIRETPHGPRTKKKSQIRQKLNRYKAQIENLERLLNEFPEVSSSSYIEAESQNFIFYEERTPDESVFTGFEIIPGSQMWEHGSRGCSPPLEPPKLSPKLPTNYDEMAKSPSQVRNSPPILPRAYVTITDCMSDYFVEENLSLTRGKKRPKQEASPESKKNESPSDEPIEINSVVKSESVDVEKAEIKVLEKDSEAEDVLIEDFERKDVDLASISSMDVLEIFEDTKMSIGETKPRCENDFVINVDEPTIKRSTSSLDVIIEKTSSSEGEETKPELLVIDEARVTPDSDAFSTSNGKEAVIEKSEKEMITLKNESSEDTTSDPIPICERFPTLANWIATLSKKQQVIEPDEKISQVPVVIEQSGSYQVISPETVKTITQEVQQNDTRVPGNNNDNSISEQWRNEVWQDSAAQRPQQPLLQPYVSSAIPPLPHRQAPPTIGQEVCSPIAMAGFYARNYLDHCSMAYSYNPTIAAAASLWNSAALLQYPLIRPPSSILNSQPARIPTNLQYLGSPMNRASYHQMTPIQSDTKRVKLDNNPVNYGPMNSAIRLHAAGLANPLEPKRRLTSEYRACLSTNGQSRASSNPVNPQTGSYRNLLQQQQESSAQVHYHQEGQTRTGYEAEIGANWRTGHLLESVAPGDYNNYPGLSSWPTSPRSLLNARSGTPATPTFVPPPSVIASHRARLMKPSIDPSFRNCNTPHLGKVLSNPNSTGHYECSNCGLVNPMFKCLGCEVAFYCDENCQARHWSRHVKSCPKKMPKLKKVN